MNKKGEGTGKLILFISAVIIAGIAATVLIQMAFNLQNQATFTGQKSQEQLISGIKVQNIHAEDGSSGNTVRNFYATITTAPGSPGANIELLSIQGDFEDGTAQLTATNLSEAERNCTIGSSQADSGFWTDETTGAGNFSYVYLKKSNHFRDGYLQSGDIIMLCMRAPYEIPQSSPFAFRFSPHETVQANIESVTPDVINVERIGVYP